MDSERSEHRDVDWENAKEHMQELFDQAMAFAHEDDEKRIAARQLLEDIKITTDAIELKGKYDILHEKLRELFAQGPALKREEDRAELNRILDEMSEFPPDVQKSKID